VVEDHHTLVVELAVFVGLDAKILPCAQEVTEALPQAGHSRPVAR
jgi:hypothetical protein